MSEVRYPRGSIRRREEGESLVLLKCWGHLSMLYLVASIVAGIGVYASAKWAPELIPSGARVPLVLTIATLFLGASVHTVVNLLRWERLIVSADSLIHDRGVMGFWRRRTQLDVSRIRAITSEVVGTRGGGMHTATACALVIQWDDQRAAYLEELFMKQQLDWLAAELRDRLGLSQTIAG